MNNQPNYMSMFEAQLIKRLILGLCLISLFSVFQPFSLSLFSFGCAGVVVGGLLFNLVPLCRPDVTHKALLKGLLTVLIVFSVVIVLAMGSAKAYVLYLLAGSR